MRSQARSTLFRRTIRYFMDKIPENIQQRQECDISPAQSYTEARDMPVQVEKVLEGVSLFMPLRFECWENVWQFIPDRKGYPSIHLKRQCKTVI